MVRICSSQDGPCARCAYLIVLSLSHLYSGGPLSHVVMGQSICNGIEPRDPMCIRRNKAAGCYLSFDSMYLTAVSLPISLVACGGISSSTGCMTIPHILADWLISNSIAHENSHILRV